MAKLRVPADYGTIAAAVAVAASGDVIQVAYAYAGPEAVQVGIDNLTVTGSSQADVTITLGSGVTSFRLGAWLPFDVIGNAAGATIFGSLAANSLTGLGGADRIFAGAHDTVASGGGDDLVSVTGPPLQIDGGAGTDTLRVLGEATFGAGSITNIEKIVIADGVRAHFDDLGTAIVVQSLSGADGVSIRGTGESDLFYAGAGADRLVGNDGNDTVSYLYAGAGVTVDLASPGVNSGWGAGDSFAGIENLTGSRYDDVLAGNALANVIDGGNGDDTIISGSGDSLVGGNGADTFIVAGTASLPASIDGGFHLSQRVEDKLLIAGNTKAAADLSVRNIETVVVADGVTADFSDAGIRDGALYSYVSESTAGSGTTIRAFGDWSDHLVSVSFTGGRGADTLIGGDGFWSTFNLYATPRLVDGGPSPLYPGTVRAHANIDITAGNVRNINTFYADAGVTLDVSKVNHGVTLAASGNTAVFDPATNLTGTAFDDRIKGGDNGGVLTGGRGIDFIIGGGQGNRDTFVFEVGDTGMTASTIDRIDEFQTGTDRIHLGGATLAADRYAEAGIVSGLFEDALAKATALMATGAKDIVFVAGGAPDPDGHLSGYLFWNTDGDRTTPDQGIEIWNASQLANFGFRDLI